MMLRYWYFVIIVIVISVNIQVKGETCATGPNGVNTFGQNCEFMCHCKNDAECDNVTGNCQNGCDVKWYGPGCQLSDLAEKEEARHLDNVPQSLWAHFANDGDEATCSYTNFASAARTRPPWWRVQFPKVEIIQEMTFLTKPEFLQFFKGFKVTVETAPAEKAASGKYYPPESDVQLCYQHGDLVPSNETIHVTCDAPLQGNLVRIHLASNSTQLVLCEVRIYGGRNLAFMKNVTYSAALDDETYPGALVVNGDSRNGSLDYCFSTLKATTDYWISVNLGHLSSIKRLKITKYNDDRLRDYKIYVSNSTEQTNAVMVYSDLNNFPPNVDLSVQAVGQFVRIDRPVSRDATVICELEIYGDCLEGKCGLNCSTDCHCKTFDDKISGVCTSGCEGRWTGPGLECINNCENTEWGEKCTNQCGRCKDLQPCDVVSGYCPFGCENGTLDTPMCDTECPDGTYGENCTQKCSGNCYQCDACQKADGLCERGCGPGYTDEKCETECTNGWYGPDCLSKCSPNCASIFSDCHYVNGWCYDGCLPGWEGSRCDKECDDGFWGKNCSEECGHCLSGTCIKNTGHCIGGCEAGYKDTPNCDQECDKYKYGNNCNRLCSPYCTDVCEKVNGTCSNCTSGWKGSKCLQECEDDEWGVNCEMKCGHCLNGTCDPKDGTCKDGCLPGYKITEMCTQECAAGSYGDNCSKNCSNNCKTPETCHHVTGRCNSCKAGKQGPMCDEDCGNRTYGEKCSIRCGACVNNETCDVTYGHCSNGCGIGYKQSQLCQDECDDGYHGINCTSVCGNCKPGTTCDKFTGVCKEGCAENYKGSICIEAMLQKSKGKDGFPVAGVVGGIFAAVVVIGIGVLVCLLWRRKQKKDILEIENSETRFDSAPLDDLKVNGSIAKQTNVYENSADVRAELAKSKEDILETKLSVPPTEQQTDEIYYNEGPVATRLSETAVYVEDLKKYVEKITRDEQNLIHEFKKFPVGLQHPTTVATNPGNAGKNRYKAMYAYDHCRVILKLLADDPYSNYVNAAYIKGHFKENAYIAAQGPIDFSLDDFWRMIWEKDVHTIVMVTRIIEETKMKCVKYWPDLGERLLYDSVIVRTESEDIFAEFTIRNLSVSHQDNPNKVRQVTQFNYTGWPDKDVPRSTSSLLHFWHRVRKQDEEKKHPWLVHCSAGVGRTGTFTALDILYDQGTDQGFVDIYRCVRDLRDQRVSMVQTKDQYEYLHKVLVEAIVLPSKPVNIDDIPRVFRELQEIDPSSGKTKLLLQYESLLGDLDSGSGSDEPEENYSSAKEATNRDKNRYSNILASNDFRPFLYTQVKGCSDYINAVWVPSYRDSYAYILTQTPLEKTAIDCCRLIFEQEVSVVITFEETSDRTIGEYLPSSGSLSVGPFTVTLISEQVNNGYSVLKTYRLNYASKEHEFMTLFYKQWRPSNIIPDEPQKMAEFLLDIETIQSHAGNKPIVLQCLNGAERSGLIVVLLNIMERARFNGDVSIPQVIRQLQIRRQQIIPNFEQYKFCYSVLKAYAETNATYANM